MASIFGKERKKSATFELNEAPPEFEVLFLGKSLTERKMGRECTTQIVSKLVEQTYGKALKAVKVTITCRGLRVTEGSNPKRQRETFIPIYSVSYGAADKHYPRVFSFVTNFSKNDPAIELGRKSTMPFYCYSFVCKTPAIARAMVVYLLRAFKVAYEGWRRGVKSQRLRDKIKAGPGHNIFNRGRDDASVVNSLAPTNDPTLNSADKESSSSKSSNMTPPNHTATRADKVLTWMEGWLGKSSRRSSSDSSNASENTVKNEENEEFSKREQEFSDPSLMLNEEVDIVSELQDPEVRSVFEELADNSVKLRTSDVPAL